MKFKGEPNQLCRITKIQRSLVRKIPKSIRFNDKGMFETENPYLIKRLQTKFEVIEEVAKTKPEISVVAEEKEESIVSDVDIHKMSYKELQGLYADKTGKTAIGKKKADLIEELEG